MTRRDSLTVIEEYFEAFRDGIVRCETASVFSQPDWMDTLNRLARLRDRFLAEKPHLTEPQRRSLSKAFEEDVFIKGMLEGRQISEHVTRRGGAVIRTSANAPIKLDFKTSAGSYFSSSCVTVFDLQGKPHKVNHLEQAKEAERRINVAIRNARLD